MNAGWTDGATHADGQTGRPQEESWGAGGPVKEAELRPSSLLPHSAGNGLAAALLLTGCIDCSLTCQSVKLHRRGTFGPGKLLANGVKCSVPSQFCLSRGFIAPPSSSVPRLWT